MPYTPPTYIVAPSREFLREYADIMGVSEGDCFLISEFRHLNQVPYGATVTVLNKNFHAYAAIEGLFMNRGLIVQDWGE